MAELYNVVEVGLRSILSQVVNENVDNASHRPKILQRDEPFSSDENQARVDFVRALANKEETSEYDPQMGIKEEVLFLVSLKFLDSERMLDKAGLFGIFEGLRHKALVDEFTIFNTERDTIQSIILSRFDILRNAYDMKPRGWEVEMDVEMIFLRRI